MNKSILSTFIFTILCSTNIALGQYIYGTGIIPPSSTGYVWKVNLATCEICPVVDYGFSFFNPSTIPIETLILPDGDVLVMLTGGTMLRFSPPDPTPSASISGTYNGGLVHPNGTIYISNFNSLYTFNATNNTLTLVGNYPSNFVVYELFYQNGAMYGMAEVGGSSQIVLINPSMPSASTVAQSPPLFLSGSTTAANGLTYVTDFFVPQDIGVYDITTNTIAPVCNPNITFFRSLSAVPSGTADLPCACLSSSAGTPNVTNANGCVPNSITVSFNNDAQTDYNDIVRYILYTDPGNPTGSVLQTSTAPTFNYSPPIQPGITYYIARVVGNASGGNIDLNDPCLDISAPIAVTWHPDPQLITLTGNVLNLCSGQCEDFTVELNGTAPFSYYWQVVQNGNIIATNGLYFQGSTSTFQVCLPAATGTGAANLVLCSVTDAFCTNP